MPLAPYPDPAADRARELAPAAIAGIGTALPPGFSQADLWDGFFRDHYRDHPLARKLWARSGVEYRHGVVNPLHEDVRALGTGARMRRFVEEAMPLGREAIQSALDAAGLRAEDVEQLTVVSCTGYATPGLDILLARDMGMSDRTQRLHIGHMGCYAAVPGLATVSDAVAARRKVSVMLCLELTSLHVQPPAPDGEEESVEQMVAHALFSDAAVALAVVPDAPGLEVLDVVARTDAAEAHQMTWDVTDLGFRMGLSPGVPDVLERHVGDVVGELLGRNGVTIDDVGGWAVHPGGPRIVDVVGERLGLAPERLEASRATLREHGNCSSGTVLLVLERLLAGEDEHPGEYVVALSFGPGLTLYAALLRRRGA